MNKKTKLCLRENTNYTVIKDDNSQQYIMIGDGVSQQENHITVEQMKILKDLSLNTISSLNNQLNIYWMNQEDNGIDSINSEKLIEFTGTNHFRVNNFVGTIRLSNHGQENIIIEIGTRFDEIGQYKFLLSMLESYFSGGIGKSPSVPQDISNMLDILLLHIFASRLKLALKKGVLKLYQRKDYNNYNFSGNIDFERHLKQNTPFMGKIAYSKREYSYDNPIMWLVIHTYGVIKARYSTSWNAIYEKDITIRNGLKMITENALSYRPTMNILSNKEVHKEITHPFYKEYEELRKISLAIIRKDALSIYGDDSKEVNSILVYIPRLWECFLKNEVFKRLNQQKYRTLEEQYLKTVMKKHVKNHMVTFYKNYLDFYIETEDKCFVFDAKYSKRWSKQSYDQDAIRQVINYVHLTNANGCGIIVPDNVGEVHNEWSINDTISTPFYVLKVKVPKENGHQNYQGFKEELKKSCSELVKVIEDLITGEK